MRLILAVGLRNSVPINSRMNDLRCRRGTQKGSLTVVLTTHRHIGNRSCMNLCTIESNKPSIEASIEDKPQIGPG